jgi:hypothetical protein
LSRQQFRPLLEQDHSLQTDDDGRDHRLREETLGILSNPLKINIFSYDDKIFAEAGQAPA